MDIENLMERLREFDALRSGDDVRTGSVERIQPQHADEWPAELHPSVRDALDRIGMGKPYKHQFDAVSKSMNGADVVLESPTASGKTLAFTVPMLHALKTNPRPSHALMIYPMKALVFDQHSQIQQLCELFEPKIESWPYDGDTDPGHREALRKEPPPILLTNPEYLNMSFLGSRESWDIHPKGAKFLRNLRYLVIDEMHEYNGFFGGNMALLLRRFFLYLNRIEAKPRVFLSTATCANPKEHAENLTGRTVEVVSAGNTLRPKRHFIFVNPDIPDFRYRDILRLRVENAALCALAQKWQTLVFCPTKKFLEEAFKNCQHRAEERDLDTQQISAFHADLNSAKRREIQQKIKEGKIDVVFTTNALELGLDIGGLDVIILAGFPPRLSSAWQQIGRAGRSWESDAFVLFYAMNDPIDQFFVGNLPAFLNKPFDELVVDPANKELIQKHIPSLIEETGGELRPADKDILGGPFYNAATKNKGTPIAGFKPQLRLNLRGGVGPSFNLRIGNEKVGQISAMRRFREAYIGGIFPFFGRRYRVDSHAEHAVVLVDVEQYLRTEPGFFTTIPISDVFDGFSYGDISAFYGYLNIVMNFTGYKLVDERSGDIIATGGDSGALSQRNLHAFWLNVPQSPNAVNGIGAVEHMIRIGAMFVIPCDRFDTSTYSKTGGVPSAYCYENYPGGIGVAKKLFSVWNTALAKGKEIARDCQCRSGCQNCIEPAKSWDISNDNIDKVKGIELAEELLEAVRQGPTGKFRDGQMVPV